MEKYNRLGKEKSPYLLQHKDNPVHWFAWGPDAFETARRENKPIFLSIGYSTCYWCHMMEKDSFERQEVADVLNAHFISIKVDREEHPDVDQIYMDAVISLTGQGGWPMSVFLTPDLKPFTGGTFFWKDQFVSALARIRELWEKEPQKVLAQAGEITEYLKEKGAAPPHGPVSAELSAKAFEQLRQDFDAVHGGFGGPPKFPHEPVLSFLLCHHRRTQNREALEMTLKTLSAMATGEIFDHVGGGFHRYATQADWNEPHYEKMLYNNALLPLVYSEAFALTGEAKYAAITRQTLAFILKELTHPEGGFFSALDAGEVGREGEYYRFSKEEREKAKPPRRDEKILTSWNGLMIAAMAETAATGEQGFLKPAQNAARFAETKLLCNGELLRRFCDHESRFPGTLDDYAFFIHGLLALHAADGDKHWLEWAAELQKKQDGVFWDEKGGGYFFADPRDASIVLKKKEFHDGALPSGNAVSALNLLKLGSITCEENYLNLAKALVERLAAEASKYPAGFPTGLIAIDSFLHQSQVCARKPNV